MKTRNIALCGVFTAIALTMYIIENQIPVPVPVLGFKIGLSNIITLITVYLWDKKHSLLVLLLRIALSAFICGTGMTLIYSLAGGLLSFCAICLSKSRFVPVTSVIGAEFHNIGQIAVAAFVLKSTSIFVYLPPLLALGAVTGLFTGLTAQLIIKNNHIRKLFGR